MPTVLVLDRIATGLDTSIARLLGDERAARWWCCGAASTIRAYDPSGWERRILSPVLPGVEFELMRTTIPGGSMPVSSTRTPRARASTSRWSAAPCA